MEVPAYSEVEHVIQGEYEIHAGDGVCEKAHVKKRKK